MVGGVCAGGDVLDRADGRAAKRDRWLGVGCSSALRDGGVLGVSRDQVSWTFAWSGAAVFGDVFLRLDAHRADLPERLIRMLVMRRSLRDMMTSKSFPKSFLMLAAVASLAMATSRAHAQTPPTPDTLSAKVAAPVESATVTAAPMSAEQMAAMQHEKPAGEHGAAPAAEDFITPHITDANHLELPWFNSHGAIEIELPRFAPVKLGGMEIDLSPTKHVFFMLLAATTAMLLLLIGAASSRKHHANSGHSRGFGAGIEAMALYLRNEVVLPNVGHHGEKFVPFALTLFFFILCCNLWGLIPYGSTATGNIAVTATLAILTAIIVEIAGIRANGLGYLSTIFYWNKDLPIVMRVIMFFVMSPVEMVGKISKPFALTIRLFANMTAGHIVLLAIIGLIFTFQSWYITAVPVLMAVAISVLELFVSFLQAFIFTLLACVFIGQIREAHH